MSLVNALAAQYERQWTMFRMTVGRITDEQWHVGDVRGKVPAWIAFHAVLWADYYTQDDPASFDPAARFGVSDKDDPARMPDRAALRGYLDEVAARTDAFLRSLDDEVLLAEETRFPWTGTNTLERVLYTLRHTTYHLGELSFVLRTHGAEATEWR